jgi:D-alanyl-D-alanine carboxypeptidase/D-alanyl-D-alanine-endopeptidase (penicillin-binding protein 4)
MKRAGIETKAAVRVLPPRAEDAGERRKDVEPFFAISWGESAPTGATFWREVRKDLAVAVVHLASPTAAEIAGAVNAHSMNTESEALLRLLDPSPRWKRHARGLAELHRMIAEAGVDTMDVSLADGSGLSRLNLATARAFVGWLRALDRDPAIGTAFREGLSSPGGTGTLGNRLPGLPKGSVVRGKTGTLTNVTALSGYVTSVGGERIVFSMVSNGTRGSVAPARVIQDVFVTLLSRHRPEAAPAARPYGIPR